MNYDPHPQAHDDARTTPHGFTGADLSDFQDPEAPVGEVAAERLPEPLTVSGPADAEAPEPSGDVVERAARAILHGLSEEQERNHRVLRERGFDPEDVDYQVESWTAARALAAAGLLVDPAETVRLRDRALGDEQCCLDTCDGGACETCLGCAAGWCVNGHDFATDPDVWEQMMSEEDHQQWFDVAREHNRGIDAALIRAETAEARARRAEDALRELRDNTKHSAMQRALIDQGLSDAGQASDATPSDTTDTLTIDPKRNTTPSDTTTEEDA